MTNHTPGPWTSYIGADGAFEISGTLPDGEKGILCSRAPWPSRFEASRANGILMTAAPEMLALLQDLYAYGYTTFLDHDRVKDMIEKAGGHVAP